MANFVCEALTGRGTCEKSIAGKRSRFEGSVSIFYNGSIHWGNGMNGKTPDKIKIEVEYRKKPALTKRQLAELKERMKCAMVMSFAGGVRQRSVLVQNIFRDSRG
jgi:hypothetical protein